MTKYSSWPTTDQGKEVGGRLKVEVRHRFSSMTGLSQTDQRDAALCELLAGTSEVFNVKSYGAPGDGTDQTLAILSAIEAAASYDTVIIGPGTYTIGTIAITKPLRVVCWGARITLSGDNAGFSVEGTVAWFRVEGGEITGDNTNRDADSSLVQIGWSFGNEAAADVADVSIAFVSIDQANIGIRFAYGTGPSNPVERVRVLGCKVTGSVGTVGGTGYGLQFTQAPGSSVIGGYIEGCGRHGLYFSEGENYNATGVHIENCGPDTGAIRGGVAISRSANVSVTACNIHDNKDVGLVIDVDAQGITPNTAEGVTVSGCTFSDNKFGDLVIGTSAPATDGVPKSVTFTGNTLVCLATTTSPIVIRAGNRIRITNNNIDASKVTGTLRIVSLTADDAATHTDDVTISRNSIEALAGDTIGIQVASSLCTGTQRLRFIDNDMQVAGNPEMEFLGTVTNTDLHYNGRDVQNLTGAGAVSIVHPITHIITTGADALTLADGHEDQRKSIVMQTDGGAGTLTPTSLGNGSTITFDDVGDSAELLFTNSAWHFMGGTATLA